MKKKTAEENAHQNLGDHHLFQKIKKQVAAYKYVTIIYYQEEQEPARKRQVTDMENPTSVWTKLKEHRGTNHGWGCKLGSSRCRLWIKASETMECIISRWEMPSATSLVVCCNVVIFLFILCMWKLFFTGSNLCCDLMSLFPSACPIQLTWMQLCELLMSKVLKIISSSFHRCCLFLFPFMWATWIYCKGLSCRAKSPSCALWKENKLSCCC